MNNVKIILASASPRRKELLEQIGIDFEIAVSDKETEIDGGDPVEACRTQAYNKAVDIVEKSKLKYGDKDFAVISADTIVAIDKKILGKPKDKSDARQMLESLSGRKHRVYTAVCVYNSLKDSYESFVEDTTVEVASLSSEEIEDYLEKKEPYDKAGAYAIQGYFSRYIVGIEGDYYNVMGLPVGRLYRDYLNKL
ncbi:Maf family protein [Lachnoanaerobaculum sp.]